MTTTAKCPECGWTQKFKGKDHYPKAKNAARHHVHDDASIEEVEQE